MLGSSQAVTLESSGTGHMGKIRKAQIVITLSVLPLYILVLFMLRGACIYCYKHFFLNLQLFLKKARTTRLHKWYVHYRGKTENTHKLKENKNHK